MKKKTIVRITSMAMAAMLTVSQLGVFDSMNVLAEETSDGETDSSSAVTAETVALKDGNFSGDFWDGGVWKCNPSTWDNSTFEVAQYSTGSHPDADAACDGDNVFHFWMQDEGSCDLTQWIDELPAGEYTLTTYVMGNGADIDMSIYDSANNKIEPTSSDAGSLAGWGNWQEMTSTFEISKDYDGATVDLHLDIAADGWGYIDHLTISGVSKSTEDQDKTDDGKNDNTSDTDDSTAAVTYTEVAATDYEFGTTNLLANGDFETDYTSGWTIEKDDDITAEVKDTGSDANQTYHMNIWNGGSGAENFSISQNVSLKAGTYLLSVEMDGESVDSGLSLSVGSEDSAVSKTMTATTGWDKWNTTSIAFTLNKADTATVKISGAMPSKYWGDIDNISLVRLASDEAADADNDSSDEDDTDDSTAVAADISVKKISGLSDDFITGADVSSYLSLVNSGACFYDADGSKLSDQGFFNLLKAGGTNYIRLRVWNNPYDENGNGYGGGNNDLDAAIYMGKLATNAGMKVLIDFHFSDFWADPGKQQAPKAWSDMTHEQKVAAISEFTTDSLNKLLAAGVDVGMVQIGNETNNGFCGEWYGSNGSNWSSVAELFNSGCKAVRSAAQANDREIKVVLHFANPEAAGTYAEYAKNLNANNVDYDVFASSYYPYWHGTTTNLTNVLKNIADTYGKEVMVAETSWATTLDDGDGHENTVRVGKNDTNNDSDKPEMNYDFSVQGQADEIAAVARAVKNVGDAGIGLFYWEAAWIPVQYAYDADGNVLSDVVASNKEAWEKYGSGWAASYAADYDPDDAGQWYGGSAVDNQSWFGFDGKALETVNIYDYIRTGTKAPRKVTSVSADDIKATLTTVGSIALPATVTVKYNDGTSEEAAVVWNSTDVNKAKEAGVGTYTVNGVYTITAESGETVEGDVTLTITVGYDNLLTNPGFESGLDGWDVSAPDIINVKDAKSNARTGKGCAHFYAEKDGTNAAAVQTVTLDAGKYMLTGYIQGGGSGEADVYSVKALVGDKTYSAAGVLKGWQVWSNPTIDEIVITEDDTEIQVVLSIENTTAGVWGSFDDIALYRIGDIDSKDNTDTKDDTDKGDSGNTDTKDDTDKGDSGNTDTKEDTDKGDSGNTDTKDDVDKENSGSTDNKNDRTPDSNNNGVSEDKNESYITEEVDKSFASFGDTVDFANGDDRTVINNGISIKGSTSALPAGVKFEVSSLAKTSKSYASAEKALSEKKLDGKFTVQEINLKDAEGTQLHQMGDYVVVTLPVPEGFTVSSTTTIAVYRLEDDGTLTKCTSTVVDGKLSFSTDHFSTYIFVEEPVAAQAEPEQKADPAEVDTPSTAPTASAAPVQTALASVKTGDDTGMGWMIMLLIAGLSAAVASAYGVKKTNK